MEERFGGFPFAIDQQFKLAIALSDKDFRFAIDGQFYSTFAFRPPTVLDKLNGFKISTSYGMFIEITSVDHLTLDSDDCDDFASYSNPDVIIY